MIATERGEFSVYSARLEPDKEQSVLVAHHGAGYSALSFANFARHLCAQVTDLAVVAVDARAHGRTPGSAAEALDLASLCDDFVEMVRCLQRQWTRPHALFLAGHSLGGAIVTWTARRGRLDDVLGVIVIDIVEEAALRSLTTMPQVLLDRPASFPTLDDAIRWSIESKVSQNADSARISVPDQLELDPATACYVWKVDLLASQQHWPGWFEGLSAAFVDCPTARLLVLAEREYLDKTLMIASMQGKFQCFIMRDTGHAIHEDQPEKLALLIASFIHRSLLVARINSSRDSVQR